jgi:hypothetical protein
VCVHAQDLSKDPIAQALGFLMHENQYNTSVTHSFYLKERHNVSFSIHTNLDTACVLF